MPGGCHDNPAEAVSHLRAIEANVGAGHKMSARERQVALYVIAGYTDQAIAYKLSLSRHTIGAYVRRIYSKVECKCRAELLMKLLLGGLLTLDDIYRFDRHENS